MTLSPQDLTAPVVPAVPVPFPSPPPSMTAEEQLQADMAGFLDDPLGFVAYAYPWGEPGPLREYDGPDAWQREVLEDVGRQVRERAFDGVHPVAPIRIAISSGHGVGKSTLTAWLVDWIMSTRPGAQGTITANTFQQLDTRTWAAIRRWTALAINQHWFVVGSGSMSCRMAKSPKDWQCSPQSCREENSEAFAGQHAAGSTSFYVFDEASAIPDKIFEVAEGGLTDGEPMIFLLGNPTRNSGKFHRSCFGSERNRWSTWCIDSRDARFTNKAQIAEWVQDYGEDSDFVRVRVRGVPPNAGDLQFIGSDLVNAAIARPAECLLDDPLIMGIDYARGGIDKTVIRFRKGKDARSIKPIKIPGEKSRDSMAVAAYVASQIERYRPDAVFGDATGGSIGGPINDRLRQLGHQVVDVQFGGASPDPHYGNMRAWIWGRMRDWLATGAIDADPQLEQDLVTPSVKHDKRDKVMLESKEDIKKRGLDSPDDADALALTFAAPVAVRKKRQMPGVQPHIGPWS